MFTIYMYLTLTLNSARRSGRHEVGRHVQLVVSAVSEAAAREKALGWIDEANHNPDIRRRLVASPLDDLVSVRLALHGMVPLSDPITIFGEPSGVVLVHADGAS